MAPPTPKFSRARLRKAAEAASAESWTAGQEWYANAQRWCRRLAHRHDVSTHAVAGIVAALSPAQGWELNKRAAEVFIAHGHSAGYPINVERARAILAGERPLDVLGGHKVTSFYRNIAYLDPNAVTIDRHAASVLTGIPSPRWADEYKAILDRVGVYESAADVYREVAEEYDVLPHELQATVWLAHRDSRPARYIQR